MMRYGWIIGLALLAGCDSDEPTPPPPATSPAATAPATSPAAAAAAMPTSDSYLYHIDMLLLQDLWKDGQYYRMQEILDRYRAPVQGQPDPRGFEWHYWQTMVQPERVAVPCNHMPFVLPAFSPDGALVAGVEPKGSITIWDTKTGTKVRSIGPAIGAIPFYAWPITLKFSPDGQFLASTDGSDTATLWDANTGEKKQAFKGEAKVITTVLFNETGTELGTLGADASFQSKEVLIQIFSTTDAKPLLSYKAPRPSGLNLVAPLALSPMLDQVAVSSEEYSSFHIHDLRKAQEVRTISCEPARVRRLSYSGDGRLIAAGCDDDQTRVYDATTGEMVCKVAATGEPELTRDGRRLLVLSNDTTIWDLPSGSLLRRIRWTLGTYPVLSNDGTLMATTSLGDLLKVIDTRATADNALLFPSVSLLAVASHQGKEDGLRVAVQAAVHDARLNQHPGVAVMNPRTGDCTLAFPTNGRNLQGLTMDPQGQWIAGLTDLWSVVLWDGREGKQKWELRVSQNERQDLFGQSRLYATADGKSIIVTAGGSISIIDAHSGKIVREWPTEMQSTGQLAVSRDSALIAASASGTQRLVRVWEAATGKPIVRWEGVGGAIAFSPDGQRLLAGSKQGIEIQDLRSGSIQIIPTRERDLAAFSPDGRRIAIASVFSVTLLDVATGREIANFGPTPGIERSPNRTSGQVGYLAFTSDGRELICVAGNRIKLYGARVPSGETWDK